MKASLLLAMFMSIVSALAAAAADAVIYTKDNAPAAPALESLPLQESVSQNGITWTFDKPVRVGKFLTGDWYVVGPVTVKAIDPKPLWGDEVKGAPETAAKCTEGNFPGQFARNGSTLNVPATVPLDAIHKRPAASGFDSRMPMNAYDPKQFTRLPIAMNPGDSLLSSISKEPYDGTPLKALAVLTCVAAPPPPDAFRPGFCQTATCKPYLARNLRRDRLLKLPVPAGAGKVSPKDYASFFEGPWVDTVGFGRAMPRKKFAYYGSQISELGGACSLLLLLDYPAADKEPLLVNMVQVGIDLHGLVRGGGDWPGEGGGAAGRKWFITFAGLMLDDPSMYELSKSFPAARFHEDDQTTFCPVVYEGKTYEHSWSGAKVIWTGHYGYYKGQFPAKPMSSGYGPTDLFAPGQWPRPWNEGSEGYRRNGTGASWVAQALAARMIHAEKHWDHDAYFAYVDRWMTEDDAPAVAAMKKHLEEKMAAAKTDEEKKALEVDKTKIEKANRGGTISSRAELLPLVKELWATYRNNLPPGPDGAKTPPAETTWK